MNAGKLLLLSTSSSRNAGGLYNSVRSLGQELFRQNVVEPTILAFNDEFSHIDNNAYTPLPLIEYNIIGPAGVAFTLNLHKKIKQLSPDIIHLQGIWLYTSLVNASYCLKAKIPYIISPRGMLDPWILKNGVWKKKLALFFYELKNIKNASCLHALGIPEYNALRKFGCKNPIAIVPNGIYLPAINNKVLVKEESVPQWNEDNRKVMLFLSRLHPKKGLENLLRAWQKLTHFHKDWKLVIAGESKKSDYLEGLKSLQAELKMQNDIFFIGPQFHKDKDACFKNSDAFILPSYSEGMPMAVLEAWSFKLPVLITDDCNLPDGFENKAAIRITPEVESIYIGLSGFFNLSEEVRKEIGENGFRLVKEKYTWGSVAKQMTDVYQWLLGNAPMPNTVKLT